MKIAVHKNTKCIVTGGSQGLGFAIAERLVATRDQTSRIVSNLLSSGWPPVALG